MKPQSVRPDLWNRASEKLTKPRSNSHPPLDSSRQTSFTKPRIYDTNALKFIEQAICSGRKTIVLSAPAGIGKTIGINHVLSKFVKRPYLLAPQHNGVTPTKVVCESSTPFRVTLSPCVEFLSRHIDPTIFHYAMSGETSLSADDYGKPHVLIMTTGYANERANHFHYRSDYHYIYFIDEAHDTSKETSLSVRCAISMANTYNNVQVIFSSATLDLSSPIVSCHPQYIIIEGDVVTITESPPVSFPTGANVDMIWQKTPVGPKWHDRAIAEAKAAATDSSVRGDIAIMCPSKEAINSLISLAEASPEFADFNIYGLHSELEREASDTAIRDISKRKLIISTNVIENSITIPRLDVMIESCIRKVPFVDADGVTELREVIVSKANSIQSAGRVGRTGRRGKCIMLITKEDYDNLPETAEPDITRAPLYYYLMQLIKRNLSIHEVLGDIDRSAIERDLAILVIAGVITKEQLNDGYERYSLTPIGEIVSKLPLSLRSAICIAKAVLSNRAQHLYYLCLLCCYADMKGDLLYRPSKKPREDEATFSARCDELQQLQKVFESHDTVEFLLRVWSLQYLDPTFLKIHGVYERKIYELNSSLENLLSNLYPLIGAVFRPYNHEETMKSIGVIRESFHEYISEAYESWSFKLGSSKVHTIHRTALTNKTHSVITALSLKRYNHKYSIYKFIDFTRDYEDDLVQGRSPETSALRII